MGKIFPAKLKPGDEVRVIAPARSLALLSQQTKDNATSQLEKMGLRVSFGDNCLLNDDFNSSSVEDRLQDFHAAFADQAIACVLAVIGGFNCNQLLQYIDWSLVKANPKIFCGYSDITALNNAIFTMTGLVNYSGPSYSTFGQKHLNSYTLESLKKCLFSSEPIVVEASGHWSDFAWWLDPDRDDQMINNGWTIINNGTCEGTLLGANLCTFNLLQGTPYFPDIRGSVLFIEDDEIVFPAIFDRDLQSLIHQPGFDEVRGLVIGRFQQASKMEMKLLEQIIKSKRELAHIPVIANVDFGHTEPKLTLPIGGHVKLSAERGKASIDIFRH